jgi:hypothetical protein
MRARTKTIAGVVFITATLLVLTFTVWSPSGHASASAPDTIQYAQQTGSGGTYIKYIPGDGSTATTQAVTSGGGCATPTPSGPPILAFSAKYYANGYNGASTAAVVGAYKSRTGVCQVPQAWSIEVNEALDFSVGPNALVQGRYFSRAVLQLEREDKSTSSSPPVQGQLVEFLAGSKVGSQPFSLAGPNGGVLPPADTGTGAGSFDTVEVQVTSPSTGSISVVGPTSTFTIAPQICLNQTITNSSTDGTASSGQVTANITYLGSATSPKCKSYSFFGADAVDPNNANGKSITFLSQSISGAHVTATFDWGYFPYCRADATPDANVPACPTTYFVFPNGTTVPQTYCAQADPNNPAVPWCTTSRHYDYVLDPGGSGNTVVHITETWDGYGDSLWRTR